MPYVSRDDAGNINGLFANPQGFLPSNEFLADEDAEVVAFKASTPAALDEARAGVALDQVAEPATLDGAPTMQQQVDALTARLVVLEKKAGITP